MLQCRNASDEIYQYISRVHSDNNWIPASFQRFTSRVVLEMKSSTNIKFNFIQPDSLEEQYVSIYSSYFQLIQSTERLFLYDFPNITQFATAKLRYCRWKEFCSRWFEISREIRIILITPPGTVIQVLTEMHILTLKKQFTKWHWGVHLSYNNIHYVCIFKLRTNRLFLCRCQNAASRKVRDISLNICHVFFEVKHWYIHNRSQKNVDMLMISNTVWV